MLPMKIMGGNVPPPSPAEVGADLAATPNVVLPKALVVYMDSDLGPFRCDNCCYYQDPKACSIVQGAIDPGGCCNMYCPSEDKHGQMDDEVEEATESEDAPKE